MNRDLCRTFDEIVESRSVVDALNWLAEHFCEQNDPHRLFEVRKMQSRHRAGQPVFSRRQRTLAANPPLDSMEHDLLMACREAGQRLVEQQRYQQAWQFLSPLDDRDQVRSLFESNPPDEEHVSEWIDVTLYQGAHPIAGYRRLLKEFGTCNAISTWEAIQTHLYPEDASALAESLVAHGYGEIGDNLCRTLAESDSADSRVRALIELWQKRQGSSEVGPRVLPGGELPGEWLSSLLDVASHEIASSVPHCDATHLAAIVRIGRRAKSSEAWAQLLELCRYGELFPEALQYPEQPLFDPMYADHRLYYGAFLDRDREHAIAHFTDRLRSMHNSPERELAVEIIAEWLDRLGCTAQAVSLAVDLDAYYVGQRGISPTLLELGLSSDQPQPLVDYYHHRHDLLSYAILKLSMRESRLPI
ncbi:MAG TPA: hypothetical protein PKD54_10790 [Pirellulaceae bacterium]|nr:hypothetical protein [Pirellulaceae bacterium]